MWCRRVRSQLSAYVDGELNGVERKAVAEHLSRCESCSAERESLATLTRMTSLIPEEDLPSGLHSRIMSRLAYADVAPVPARPAPRRSVPLGPFIWTAVAGATATVAFAYVQGRANQPQGQPGRLPVFAATQAPEAHPSRIGPRAPVASGPDAPKAASVGAAPREEHAAVCAIPAAEPQQQGQGEPEPRSARPTRLARKTERAEVPPAPPAMVREQQPQPLAVTTPAGKPTLELRAPEPSTGPGMTSPDLLAMPGAPIVNSTGPGQPLGAEPIVAMEKETGMRMAGSAPVEEQIVGEEDEGLRSLRMFFEERNRTVPQPPALDLGRPRRNRKSL